MQRRTQPRLLFVTRHPPIPGFDGASSYLLDLGSELSSRGIEIDLLWLSPDPGIQAKAFYRVSPELQKIGCLHLPEGIRLSRRTLFFPKAFFVHPLLRLQSVLAKLLSSLGLLEVLRKARKRHHNTDAQEPSPQRAHKRRCLTAETWSAAPSAEETAYFAHCVKRLKPDFVLLNYCWLSPLLDKSPGIPSAILANDVVSQRLTPSPARDPDPATAEGEAILLNRADYILAISPEDASTFSSWLPSKPILYTPKSANPQPYKGPGLPGRILFVGGQNTFNEEGLRWFVSEVFPLIRSQKPEVQLHVCGNICNKIADLHAPEIIKKGMVPSLDKEYQEAQLVIVPLLHGSGIKIKVVEAACHSKAIVTTEVGLQGLEFLRTSTRVATAPHSFAEEVLHLLEQDSHAEFLGRSAAKIINERLAPETAYGPLLHTIISSRT